MPQRRRLKNLVQLNMTGYVTRTDRMRFMLAYAEEVGWSQEVICRTISTISSMTKRRLRIRKDHHPEDV
jgi:hypothetical protein